MVQFWLPFRPLFMDLTAYEEHLKGDSRDPRKEGCCLCPDAGLVLERRR